MTPYACFDLLRLVITVSTSRSGHYYPQGTRHAQTTLVLNTTVNMVSKVVLVLKYHTMKRYGIIAPRVFNLGTRWRSVISFTPRLLNPREVPHGTHWLGGCVGPRACLDAVENTKKFHHCPCQESNRGRPTHSL